MVGVHPLPSIRQAYNRFPLDLANHLHRVVESTSPSDAFACQCNLLEWLAAYLNRLANSVYVALDVPGADEQVEKELRSASQDPPLGVLISALRTFAARNDILGGRIPELTAVLNAKVMPLACVRMIHAFKHIKHAREFYEIPTRKLPEYVDANVPGDDHLGKANLDRFFSALSPFRNKGHGHQATETWFPRDADMYRIVVQYLNSAVDALLHWSPMSELLSAYEVVRVEGGGRAAAARVDISRISVPAGLAPLGTSELRVEGLGNVTAGDLVFAKRTADTDVLDAVVKLVQFPQTLHSTEILARQYSAVYLQAYLERGLITPIQRETLLRPKIVELALPEKRWRQVEEEVQEAINRYSGDDDQLQRQTFAMLEAATGEGQQQLRQRMEASLESLPDRRKEYISEQIENSAITSFSELQAESELSEPDLDSVLGELEQEDRVRRIATGVEAGRLKSYYKAQDPSLPTRLRNALMQVQLETPRNGLPAPIWQIVELCHKLLADEGLALDPGELEGFRSLFETPEPNDASVTLDSEPGLCVRVEGDEIQASSVRELLTQAWEYVGQRGTVGGEIVPLLMGRTRYLVAHRPEHANGTPFAVPIAVDDVYFEGNLARTRALTETVRLLRAAGMEASSPDVEPAEVTSPDVADDGALVGGGATLRMTITPPDAEGPVVVSGRTVPGFFSEILDLVLKYESELEAVVPVATGRVRYLIADEPYHANDRPFDSAIERRGYYINTAYSYEQAARAAEILFRSLGWETPAEEDSDDKTPLVVKFGEHEVRADNVPEFLAGVVRALFDRGVLAEEDIPYKSGRVRYLISTTPVHDHGRDFIRPVPVVINGSQYYVEANASRQGAIDLVRRIVARKGADATASSSQSGEVEE